MHPIVIHGATLIDCTGADLRPHTTVVVEDAVITAIGPRENLKAPAGATVIDAAGRTLLPGLMSAHICQS